MEKSKILKFSLVTFVVGVVLLVLSYLCYHFLTDDGFSLTWHSDAEKPFIVEMIADLSALFIFRSGVTLIASKVFLNKTVNPKED